MNIYEDYGNYMSEVQELIEAMIKNKSTVYYVLTDVINVTDYIYRLSEKNEKIDEDLEEIFEIGFGYLSNILGDLKTYYEEYFEKNMEVFNYYSELMLYSIYIEDYKDHLNVEELITDDIEKILNDLIYMIDGVLVNKKPYDGLLVANIEGTVDDIKVGRENFQPVYNVFRMIAETLELE